ncbi:HSP20-like chaperone [Crucibulum laeve]|uniref:HSP20-like chaperone n=1 Tax=Crucibulum laeve TaxID=68775 RepID=A0A5C3MA18_9AGAR|nr:HSP20-like chaperone [Crucibulum laeve]
MSIARQLFQEFRPFIRLLEDPFARTPASFYGFPSRTDDPFTKLMMRPAVDITEEGDKYILDADLPGVKKENIEVRIGDNGESITIQGRIMDEMKHKKSTETSTGSTIKSDSTSIATKSKDASLQIANERPYTRNVSFTRTVWLPRPVDTKNVSAKLDHGVLTITVQKSDSDKAATTIPVD